MDNKDINEEYIIYDEQIEKAYEGRLEERKRKVFFKRALAFAVAFVVLLGTAKMSVDDANRRLVPDEDGITTEQYTGDAYTDFAKEQKALQEAGLDGAVTKKNYENFMEDYDENTYNETMDEIKKGSR